MKAIRISLLAAVIAISATGFSQKTVTKMVLDSIVDAMGKNSYSYDERGRNTQSIIGSGMYEYTYDDVKGNLTEHTGYTWKNNQWTETEKCEYTYDSTGNLTLRMVKTWNNSTNSWRENKKYEYTYYYDVKGNLTEYIQYNWNNSSSEWYEYWKFGYLYDVKGNRKRFTLYHWKTTYQTNWREMAKIEYAYDSIGNMIEEISYSNGCPTGCTWQIAGKLEYTYNLSHSKTNLVVPNDFDYTYNNMLIEGKGYNYDGKNWNFSYTTTYYWSAKEIEVKDVGIVGAYGIRPIQVFPNPTSGMLHISGDISDGKDIQIYDIVGKCVLSQPSAPSPETTIDISHLANGMYFLKIDNKMYKIIKK